MEVLNGLGLGAGAEPWLDINYLACGWVFIVVNDSSWKEFRIYLYLDIEKFLYDEYLKGILTLTLYTVQTITEEVHYELISTSERFNLQF